MKSPRVAGDFVYWLRQYSDGFNGYAHSAIHRTLIPGADCVARGSGEVSRKLFESTPKDQRSDYVESIAVDGGHVYSAGRRG